MQIKLKETTLRQTVENFSSFPTSHSAQKTESPIKLNLSLKLKLIYAKKKINK